LFLSVISIPEQDAESLQIVYITCNNSDMKKRTFLKSMALAGAAFPFSGKALPDWMAQHAGFSADELASDDAFWTGIRGGYRLKPDYINLENGFYNFLPEEILEKFIQNIRDINYQGSWYMRTIQIENKKKTAARVAGLLGCSADELILTRNTTESLDMIIGGFPWQPGDEAVFAEQDYGSMRDMFSMVSKDKGIVNKIISIPNNPVSDDEIVKVYADAITPRTKLMMVCHIVNITGQILPIRKICDMAHSKGVQVMVDGAHAVAHFRFSIDELNCDYYGSSLHKWLSAPLGVGILYVRKERIASIHPLLARMSRKDDDISRLNHTGTHPAHNDISVNAAIDFYEKMGPERKEKRLRFLQQYWTAKVRPVKGVEMYTPEDPARSCAIANVGVRGMKPSALAETLLKEFGIFTVGIDTANVHGCRITPNVYTTTAELDVLVKAVTTLAARYNS
jgi:selenocysteine lyase/cysteine desulfurase